MCVCTHTYASGLGTDLAGNIPGLYKKPFDLNYIAMFFDWKIQLHPNGFFKDMKREFQSSSGKIHLQE